jgi:hypothetical protein
MAQNMLGAYGDWAAAQLPDPPRLSFRQPMFRDVNAWRNVARARFLELLRIPLPAATPVPTVEHRFEFDGLAVEHLRWQLPYGPSTEAVLLKPLASAGSKLPGIVALHDHGGNKAFGFAKITRITKDPHPVMVKHQERYYGGLAWANEIARRGYVVLVHDTFSFASRRFRWADVPAAIRNNMEEANPQEEDEIQRFNQWAAQHEHIIAKSLFCSGLTWPGLFVHDDQRALDYLASRPEVDALRLG